jgi:mRNA-degrading endonuclease toxin of MazEF toxin-antitoxin module
LHVRILFYILSHMGSKDYEHWHIRKLAINNQSEVVYFDRQEVWWLAVGCNIGYEEDGKGTDFLRPVLIFCKFSYRFFLGIPLSTTPKTGRFYHQFQNSPRYKTALLSQIRAFDARRLINKDGWISEADMHSIQRKLSRLIRYTPK